MFRNLFKSRKSAASRRGAPPASSPFGAAVASPAPADTAPRQRPKIKAAAKPPAPTPEQLCGVDPGAMSQDQIKQRLAQLYRRYNAAAGSLNQELRDEADAMLDAIVTCREKYIHKA